MRIELSKGVWCFVDDDDAFIQWCHDNPDGFFWNCGRYQADKVLQVYTLNSAIRNGNLCPHFRNSNRADGYENNLTTTHCKVCGTNRRVLEKWARAHQGGFKHCSSCISLP